MWDFLCPPPQAGLPQPGCISSSSSRNLGAGSFQKVQVGETPLPMPSTRWILGKSPPSGPQGAEGGATTSVRTQAQGAESGSSWANNNDS